DQLAIEAEQERGQLGGGIRVHDVAHHGAAVAYRRMGDPSQRLGPEGRALPRPSPQSTLPHQPGDGWATARFPPALQIAAAVDVHERRRPREAEREHGNETLPAREDLGAVAMAAQRLDRVRGARGGHVLERRGLHGFAAPRIRSRTTEGPSGVRVTRAFHGASASSTALAMAAGGEIAPPSPMPLMPRGFRGDGYSRCTVSMGGSSMAVGTR